MIFSVVVPVYNSEKYLKSCIDSILSQDFDDYELILVDDGSKDSSGAILDKYAEENKNIRVIHKPNGGQSSARNTGVQLAQGEYLVFLDSDDFYLTQNAFSLIAEKCKASPDIVAFKYKKFFDETNKLGACGYSFSDISNDLNYSDKLDLLVRKDAFFCSAWSKVVKRSVIIENNIRFDENSRCEDMDWYFNVVTNSSSISLLDEFVVAYRQREGSVTSSGNQKTINDFIGFFDSWRPKILCVSEDRLKNVLLNASAKLYLNLLIGYCGNGEKKDGVIDRIKAHKDLLKYHNNPRVNKVYLFYRLFGFSITVFILKMIMKTR